MNQFFAVSSHTPLPATDTLLICMKFIESASHAMLSINTAYPWLTGKYTEPLQQTTAGAENCKS